MKLSEYIKELQELEAQGYGEFELIYSSDSEGNNYHKVGYSPGLMMVDDLSEYYLDIIHPDDAEEYAPNVIIVN